MNRPSSSERAQLGFLARTVLATVVLVAAIAVAGTSRAADEGAKPAAQKPAPAATASAPAKPQPRLKFNFRFQRWAEVLEWFAQQCDLSLVLDAPPPGTFNYTDSRQFTPPEAIDLLNSVLQTKDFTLIRRGRMLMTVDLKNGVPDDLVPQVELKDLDERGKFEFVRVTFPLGNRSAKDVETEIKPLLSKNGKCVSLPKTRQVIVTDHAGIMRAVSVLITSLPEPPAPPAAKGPETPAIAVYPLKNADGQAAIETLRALLPGATFVFDAKAGQLNAFATPSQQAAVKAVVAQLQAETPSANRPRLELYPLEAAGADAAVHALSAAFPKAQFQYDAANSRLVAWAPPQDHQQIKNALSSIDGGGNGGKRIETYRLERADGASVLTLLQTLVPQAKISLDSATRTIVALAGAPEHEAIKNSLRQLATQKTEMASKNTLHVYPLSGDRKKRFDRVSKSVMSELPSARIVSDADGELAVWASPDDHRVLEQVLRKLDADAPPEQKSTLATYNITSADPTVVYTVMQQMFPGPRMVLEPKSKRLLVWARAEEQTRIREGFEKIDGGQPASSKEQLRLFPYSDADPTVAITLLQQQLPDVRLSSDTISKSIIAWGSPSDLEAVARMLKLLQTKKPVSQVYRLKSADPNAALAALQAILPQARMTVDLRNRSLVAIAFPEEQLRIQSTLEQMDQPGEGDHALTLKSYALSSAEAAYVLPMLQTLFASFPEVRLSAEYKTQTIMAVATAAQHQTIKKSIDDMEKQSAARVLRVYRFKSADPSAAYTMVTTLAPKAQAAIDTNTRSLVVSALESDHEKIRKMVDEIDAGGSASGTRELRTYALNSADPSNALYVLQTLFAQSPDVRLSVDLKADTIVAFARPDQHETIKKSIDEMESKSGKHEARSYPLRFAQVDSVVPALATLTPRAQITFDRRTNSVIANASTADHARIKTAVAQMDLPSKSGEISTVKAYRLKTANPANVLNTMQPLFATEPDVRLSADPTTGSIMVFGNKDQQAKVEQIISQIDDESAGKRFELEVFTLQNVDPFTAELTIGKLFNQTTSNVPPPTIESDQESQQLFVRATKEQLAEVRALLTKMGEPGLAASNVAGGKGRIRVIRFSGDAGAAVGEIQRVWPSLRGNPIRVVVPSAVAPTLRQSDKPVSPSPQNRDKAPAQKPTGGAQFSVDDPPASKQPAAAPKPAAAEVKPAAAPVVKKPAVPPLPIPKVTGEKKPVIISFDNGSITISSDDPEALDQLETLLRTMSKPTVDRRSSDFIVFSLKHAAADGVAGMLQQLFRSGASPLGFASGRMTAVADDRMNAVVVRAPRGERRQVEDLLQILDSPDVPETLARDKPRIIPVKNTRAEQIVEVLRGVYRKQMTAMGGRRMIPVPSGVSTTVAAAILQANAAGAGPLLTLEADPESNSIIVMGPESLTTEISRLIADLDVASLKDASHAIKLLPLESMNSTKIHETLDRLMQNQGQGSGRSRGSRGSRGSRSRRSS